MKKLNKLFAILFAVLGVTTLKAQTDVTSQYLKNANFSSTDGWTQHVAGYKDIGSGKIGEKLAGYAASSTDATHLNSEYFFGFQCRWSSNYASYNQETSELPAGVYTLSYDVQNRNGSTTAASYNNLFYVKVGEKTYTDSYTEWMTGSTGWTSHSITFTITSASKATISLGYGTGANNFETKNTPVLYVSHLKLEYTSFDDALESGWTAPQVPGTDIASLVGTGVNVGMYNVKADAFTTRAMNWSTQAAATKLHNSDSQTEGTSNRHHVNVVKGSGSTIKFNFPCINDKTKWLGDGGQGSTKAVFTDNKSQNYEFNYSVVSAKTHVYTLKVATATSEDNAYLDVWQPYGGQLTYAEGQGFTEWAFIRFSDIENGNYATYKAKKALYEIYQAVVAAGHENTYQEELRTAFMTYIRTDVTAADVTAATNVLINAVSPVLTAGYVNAGALFTNSDIRGAGTKADWTSGYTSISWGCFENYHTNHGERKLTQTKSVPNGFYKVVFHGIWRQDGSDAAPTLTLRSGDNSVSANVPCMTDIDFGVGNTNNENNWINKNGKIIPNGMQSAGEGLSHGSAQVTISDFVVSDGQLTIEMNSSSTSQWILAQGFDIYFKAESMEEYANLFNEAKAAADAIDVNTLNTYAKNTLTTALNNAAAVQINKEWYQARTAELNNAVTIANDVATAYPKASALLEICNNIVANSIEFVEGAKIDFSSVANTAKTDVEAATTADAINAIYNTLESARRTYVQQADPTNGIAFDYTFLVKNPSFETGDTNGWTTSSGGDTGAKLNSDGTYTINGADGEFVFNTWGAENMRVEQALKGIPTGIYTLKAIVASDANSVIKLTAGNQTEEITITTNKSTATEGVVETSYSSGDFLIKAASATWFKADHFRLYYYGFDVPTAQNGVTTLKAEAEALVEKPMNKDVATALNSAIVDADATKTTRNELNPMIDALNEAIKNAEASIAEYELIRKYIDKAKKFDEDDAELVTLETQYSTGDLTAAEPVRQALNVWTYNYVNTNFRNEIALTEWGATNNAMWSASGEHWDGTTGEGCTSYYDANGTNTTHTLSKTVELTPGTYIFRGAGRSNTNTTLSLSIDIDGIEPAVFNPKGNTGRGIDKEGNATFADDAQYARDGQGQGWEWEFIKFTLNETTTVTLTATCQTSGWGWASFANNGLWMDDATYVVANAGALTAPLAAAKALVDTKPMGVEENAALASAIALGEAEITTPAQLNGAIDALNTAVANANTWVAEYNAAKAPLVAALERFEADYNGVKMSKSDWENVLNKVKAAAVAKDVTNSYDGFAAATENLVDALDAAQASIEAYAALNEAIESANTVANGGNIGDAPFQRPVSAQTALKEAIATAQEAYDAAEADDVTEVKDALAAAGETFNNVELNAPAEGARYNIVMDYAGWEHHGKAVTYLAGGRNDAGLYNIQYYAAPNANYAQAFTFTAVEGKANCYTLSMTDVDGNERYVCTGVAYGGNTSQIRTTTDAAQALAVKVIATKSDGIHQLYNTEANNYIGGQDAGFYTVNSHTNFNLVAAEMANVTLTISSAGWATLILPFNAALPEGVKAYSCGNVAEDGETLTLVEAESIEANKPYLVSGAEGSYSFSGYGLADKDSYKDGLFTGTYVKYETTANSNTYVLQNQGGEVAFYLVGESAQPKVGAYRCYMTYDAGTAAAPAMFSLGRGEGTTGIDNSEFSTQDSAVVYDLMGRRVTTMEKGSMYIVNGKKVVVK